MEVASTPTKCACSGRRGRTVQRKNNALRAKFTTWRGNHKRAQRKGCASTWSALLFTYVQATVRERMHVGALCLPLIDLALHRPPQTLFGTGSCRSVFCLASPARARSFDQGWSHREPGFVSTSQCPHLPGLRAVYACVNQAFTALG